MKKAILICTFFMFQLTFAASTPSANGMTKTLIGVRYFSKIMGNIHQNPSRYSQVLSTISCNQPLKVMKETSKDGKEFILYGEDNWNLVSVGPYEGYILTEFISDKKVDCLDEEHAKFFEGLNLDINDMYYWARLYDQFIQGKSKINTK